jgi:hypothetical protein
MPVTQPSEWQRDYAVFNRRQLELAMPGAEAARVNEVTAK